MLYFLDYDNKESTLHLKNTLHLHQFCGIFKNLSFIAALDFLQKFPGYIENFLQLFGSFQLEFAFLGATIFVEEIKPTRKSEITASYENLGFHSQKLQEKEALLGQIKL